MEQCILFDLHKWPNQTLSAKLVEIFWWGFVSYFFLLSLFFFFLKRTSYGAYLFKKLLNVNWDKDIVDMLEEEKGWQVTDTHVWYVFAIMLYYMTCMEFIGATLCNAIKHNVNKITVFTRV